MLSDATTLDLSKTYRTRDGSVRGMKIERDNNGVLFCKDRRDALISPFNWWPNKKHVGFSKWDLVLDEPFDPSPVISGETRVIYDAECSALVKRLDAILHADPGSQAHALLHDLSQRLLDNEIAYARARAEGEAGR